MGIAQYGTYINAPSTSFVIYARNPTTNDVDMEIPISQFAYALRLSVPEKATKQYNFCFLPKPDSTSSEPIIWTVNQGPLKSCNISNPVLAKIASGPEDVLETALDFILKKSGISLTYPTAEEFASATPESHRKGEKAYHVKAFRGSKDGFLFFLHNGIFFGFKKPLAFFAFEDVVSISYTSVLQRTFNLNIGYRPSGLPDGDSVEGDVVQEVEFSMLDQADFPGIDAYIKRHGLQDASLAASRRAARYNTAKGKASAKTTGGQGEDNEEEDDGRTELEKAQQQLEDEEDEEEEDYDPGSDGESEGSGESEDEDDDDDHVHRRTKTKARDLVADELGSEAEDVSVTEDEDEEIDAGDSEVQEDDEEEVTEDAKPARPDAQESALNRPDGMPDPYDEDQL